MTSQKLRNTPRRLCFDAECGKHWPYDWWGDIPQRRAKIQTWKIRFDAVVVYDVAKRRYQAFDVDHLTELVDYLATADELVSFNARRWDMLILENLCGQEKIRKALWSKPHHDLHGWKGYYKLKDLSEAVLQSQFLAWGSTQIAKHRKLMKEGWRDFPAFQAATAWRDVQFTYGIFRLYLAEGGGAYTYEPGSEYTP